MEATRFLLLVADGDPVSAEQTGRALRKIHPQTEVDVVTRGEECLSRADARPYDLIVLDDRLPAEKGFRILDALSGRPGGPPIIVLTESGSEEAAVDVFRHRGADYLVKSPNFLPLLAMRAKEHAEKHRALREWRESRRRIRALEAFNESILQNIRSAILVTDNDGRIVYANRAATAMLGYGEEEIRRLDVGGIFGSEEDGPPLLSRTIARGETFQRAETTAFTKAGKRLPVGLSTSVRADAAGRGQGAIAIVQDLSEIRALQQQVFQSEKMASIGQLAAGVAHEINNPMGFIDANLTRMAEYVGSLAAAFGLYESLRTAVAAGEPARIAEALERATEARDAIDVPFVLEDLAKAVSESREGAERITHIVQNLREFSHVDPAERVPADIHRCIDGTANMIMATLRAKVDLVREYGDVPPVRCFPMQLSQVFMNLFVNACQAIEERGEIRVRTCTQGDRVVITIADTGRGIAPEHLDRIFDPFFTTKEVGVGTGLGLSTTYSIIQRHRGTIAVRSEPGRGTVFTITLPLA